jgi:hypothetical protein
MVSIELHLAEIFIHIKLGHYKTSINTIYKRAAILSLKKELLAKRDSVLAVQ